MRVFFTLLLGLAVAAGQDAPKPAAAKPAAPSDAKLFSAAANQKDPAKRVVELEKFLKEQPKSPLLPNARRQLISALVETAPRRAVKRTRELTKGLGPIDSAGLNRTLAVELNDAKKLPRQAEKAAQTALAQFQFSAFAENAKKDAEKSKRPVQSDEQLQSRFKSQRAQMNETLGQALLARGKTTQAQAAFEQALQDNPSLGAASLAMGQILEKQGKTAEALEQYARGMLARPSPESRARFSAIWEKAKGSGAGAQEYLDEKYKALYPNPLHPAKYEKTEKRSGRIALGEVYTGAGCGPCVAADLAFEAVLERYGRNDVAVVMYHEHIPRPDPMTNPDTLARWKWQEGRGVPTYAVDGKPIEFGGGPRDTAGDVERRVRELVDKQLESAPGAELKLQAANDGRAVKAQVEVQGVQNDSPDLVLNVLLVEKELRYSGENGIRFHPMVVRSVATFPLNGEKAKTETHTFALTDVAGALEKHLTDFEKHDDRHNKDGKFRFMEHKDEIDSKDLAVVAFVQDTKTKEVLQAAYSEARQ